MNKLRALIAVVFSCLLFPSAQAEVRVLLDSGKPGPTLLVLTEVARNELSIAEALKQVQSWSLACGRLVTASAIQSREAVENTLPAAVLTIRTVRSSEEPANLTTRGVDCLEMQAMLNALTDQTGEKLSVVKDESILPPGVEKAARISLAIKNRGTVPAARTRLFRHAIFEMLRQNDMIQGTPWKLHNNTPQAIDVALYAGQGSNSTPGLQAYPRIMNSTDNVRFTFVGPAELRHPGMLEQFDVVVFCGGMSRTQSSAIGPEGAQAVRDFVQKGGGYVSSCAGAYLASAGFDWSLRIIDSVVIDYSNWLRGSGDVDIELTEEGRKILGDHPGLLKVRYANGPLLAPGNDPNLPDFKTLAHYRSDMAKSAPGGVMPNTPAIIAGEYGEGRVLCFSPHPEYTQELNSFIINAIRWAAKKAAE